MKKKLIIIGVIGIVLIIIGVLYLKSQPYSEAIWNMVLDNEEEYTTTALIYYEDFQQQDAEILKYSTIFQQTDGTYVMNCYPELFHMRKIVLSDTEGASGMVVRDSYYLDKNPWTGVYVYDEFVTFGNFTGRESLIYSIDGTRPSYVNCPNEDFDRIWVHKITDNWYHAIGE